MGLLMTNIRKFACLCMLLLLIIACGEGAAPQAVEAETDGAAVGGEVPTDTQTSASTEISPEASGYAAVMAEVSGLAAEERWSRLVELAEEEDGTLMLYVTMSADEVQPLMDGFKEATGSDAIETEFYRAHTDPVLQRILEEESADARQVDALIMTGTALEELSNDGLLQPFTTPLEDTLVENGMHGDWAAFYINLYTAAWNTNLVSQATAPTTWEDVFQYDAGAVGVEILSYDWFGTLVTDYFMEEKGMSEEEAIALFVNADFVPVSGRTALTEFTAAGEFHVAASTYTQNVDQFVSEGAPIAWRPPVEPLVLQENGAAPVADSDVPATALLFMDYLLGESAQELLAGAERIPSNVDVDAPLTADEFDFVTVDVVEMVENRQKWESLFAEVTGEPIAGN